MAHYPIEKLSFDLPAVEVWAQADRRRNNWPVVYVLDNAPSDRLDIYVGETLNAASRMRQHLANASKRHLTGLRVVIDDEFNKSVCLDLESFLIQMLAGDGQYRVLNRNAGVTEAEYFDRERYQRKFDEVFESLRSEGVFSRTIPQIRNSDLFKLSPFKALAEDQAVAVEAIVDGLFEDLKAGRPSTSVVQGEPGTGKTIVAIYLLKLLSDVASAEPGEEFDLETFFSDFFTEGYRELAQGLRIGLVVPQQSLRKSIEKVFRKTPGLTKAQVLTPYDVGKSAERFDLLVVDEAHRLTQKANQSSAMLNISFSEINLRLFGNDDPSWTQLDWIWAQSRHQIFLVDGAQSVRPLDVPTEVLDGIVTQARADHRHYPLLSQMRVRAGDDYVGYVRRVLEGLRPEPQEFRGYDLRYFDNFRQMWELVQRRESEHGLSRLVAGYAWPWVSKKDRARPDITIDGLGFRWNTTSTDWINSPDSPGEVGSIHTVQGYDLNYSGVIIGPDLRYDVEHDRIVFDRSSYFDSKGKENNPVRGLIYTDEDLQRFVTNIYAVLLTRGMRGTFVHVVDPALREYLRPYFSQGASAETVAD